MAVTLESFKLRFPEFASESDVKIQIYLDDSVWMFDSERWGEALDLGTCNYIAHNLTLANQILFVAGSTFPGSAALTSANDWTSKSVGDVSVTRNAELTKAQADNPFLKTTYGQEYLRLRRLFCIGAVSV
jgi:hypothetical protein